MMQGGPHGAGGITTYIIQRTSEHLPTVVNLRRDVLCAAGALCPCGPAPGQWPIAHCARSAVEGYQWELYPGPRRWDPEGTPIVCRLKLEPEFDHFLVGRIHVLLVRRGQVAQ